MVGLISAVRLCHRESGFWVADDMLWLKGVPVCLQYSLSPGSYSLVPGDAFPSPHSLIWPCSFLQQQMKKGRKSLVAPTQLLFQRDAFLMLPFRKASFSNRVCQGLPSLNLGVLGSSRLSERSRNELTAGLAVRWESTSLPCRVIEEGPQVAGTNRFTISVARAFPVSAGTD